MSDERHFILRSSWLRAAVLGANDGILSTASIAIGVAVASSTRFPIFLASLAGLVAGALSMAAGEYVSVSSQADLEAADLERERTELETMPEEELHELAKIYENRGLTPQLSMEVATQLTKHNALEAHARDELGINDHTKAQPLTAALASAASFVVGGLLPVIVTLLAPLNHMVALEYGCSILFLALSGVFASKVGGSPVWKSVLRICIWGTLAMALTALVGYIFGVQNA